MRTRPPEQRDTAAGARGTARTADRVPGPCTAPGPRPLPTPHPAGVRTGLRRPLRPSVMHVQEFRP